MKPQKKAKLLKRLESLEKDQRDALTKKANGAAEIDLSKIQERINEVRRELQS